VFDLAQGAVWAEPETLRGGDTAPSAIAVNQQLRDKVDLITLPE